MKIFISSIFLFLAVTSQVLYSQLNGPEYLCGTDDRVPFNHLAVGRIITEPNGKVSTGWILFDGRIVTASHVFDLATEGSFIEFNVPESNGCGSWGHPPAEHKYYIDMNSIVRSNPHPVGNDWAIFSVEPNRTTGLLPKDAQNAFFYVEQSSNSSTLELIGFGEDDESSRCYASQKSIGNYSGLSGSIIKHTCDTRWGNSGSPIINTTTGKVIGIHTTGTCDKLSYNQGTSTYNTGFWSAVYSDYNFVIHQKRNSGTELTGSKINRWIGSYASGNFQEYTVGTGGAFIEDVVFGSYETFRSFQEITEDAPYEKYNNWEGFTDVSNYRNFLIQYPTNILTSKFKQTYTNTTFDNVFIELPGPNPSSDVIEFKDPWLIDYDDPVYFGTDKRNQGMNAPFKLHTAPFRPDYTTSYSGDVYKGVFLNQLFQDGIYYSVNSPDMQPITVNGQTHKFFLQNWSGTGVTFQSTGSPQTGVVFTSGSAVVTANLKGQLLSNEGSGFSSNGQRKIVRDNSGFYHSVYTSQNLVWYTKSTTTSFTGGWDKDEIMFSEVAAKNPSMDINGNILSVVAEVQDGSAASIYLYDNGSYTEVAQIDNNYYGSSYPVVSRTNNEIFIIYKPSSTSPLKYRRYYHSNLPPQNWTWTDEADLPFSTSNSKYPSITGDKGSDDVYITWQEGTTQIKYLYSHRQGDNHQFFSSDFITVSNGSGYSNNTNPSISLTPSGPFVSWTGSRKENSPNKIIGKETLSFVYRAIMRAKSVNWGDFYVMGDNVNYTNNNSTTNSNSETVIAYSRDNGQLVPWARRVGGYYTGFGSISHNGLQVNLSNGSSLSNLKAMVFNTAALPYPINRSTTDFTTTIPKLTTGDEVSYGRTGVISKQDVEFVFTVEDILLNDNNIEFTSRVDTLPVLSLEELNSAARSNTFNLDENSSLYFSLYYLVINPELASTVLGENDYVRFKLELVKTVGDQVVGVFDDITFTKDNAYDHENTSYKVDCTGIESGSYYFRISADENCQTGLSIANTQNDAGNLAKKNYTEVYFNGETSPLTYDLSQNYPNPFNPSTTIKFQIPNAGNVTLKVFDILGREVTTLVDEFKNEGRYEVNFNAGKLASGVYIYTIKSNDFTASKKLMLVK